MTFDSKTYIIDLIIQLNLNNMDDATRARLEDLQKKHVATSDQEAWHPGDPTPKLDEQEPGTGTSTYRYTGDTVGAPGVVVPNAENSLDEIYGKLVKILRDVAADNELMADSKVKAFVDDFYGTGLTVEPYASQTIPPTDAAEIGAYIANGTNLGQLAIGTGIKESDLRKLQDALLATPPTYSTNPKVLKTFNDFLVGLYNWNDNGGRRPLPDMAHFPTPLGGPAGIDYDQVLTVRDTINTPVPPTNTQKTQLGAGIEKMFGKLVANDKLREKVLSKDEDGDITRWINAGLDKSNYKEGDNALSPKYDDRKTAFERAKDKIKKNYIDTLGKLNEKHTRHIYSTNARYIVEQLIKKEVKPTDGTKKILETLDAITGELPNPVQSQVKWMKETLSKMKGTKFFEQALEDGDQMRQLVEEVIKAAVHDGKMEEARVTLETLAVMRYTITSSAVRDKLKKTEVSIFSDPKLSINKGPMQYLTSALDKVIKTGMMAAFEVGNLAKNAIKEYGVKFGHGEGRLDERVTGSADYADAAKKAQMQELFAFWDFVNSSANSKDYNIFRKHSNVQKSADTPTTGSITNSLTGEVIDDPTEQRRRFIEWMNANNIGRV
ncbi:MAG: hypothetical protein E7006_01830 [Alphaproteobacteria bacterium]|nr:hypothetical protein [Alphaproteobacteria bacterium]